MSRNCPEQHRQRNYTNHHQKRDENRTSHQKLLHVGFTNGQSPEGGRLASTEEHEDRVELILMRDEAKDRDREGDEELHRRVQMKINETAPDRVILLNLRRSVSIWV